MGRLLPSLKFPCEALGAAGKIKPNGGDINAEIKYMVLFSSLPYVRHRAKKWAMKKASRLSLLSIWKTLFCLLTLPVLLSGCGRSPERLEQSRVPAKESEPVEDFVIFEHGQPMASLVLSEAAANAPFLVGTLNHLRIPEGTPNDVVRAVELFRRDLQEGFGIELPMGADAEVPNRIEIDLVETSVAEEDITEISFPSANTMRIRGGQSGIIRTLFYLLEEFAGVRYLFQGAADGPGIGIHYPERTEMRIPQRDLLRRSAYPMDRSSGQTATGSHWEGERNRVYWWPWEARLGTKTRVPSAGHSLPEVAFPIDAYEKAEVKPDPEIFPIQHGKRVLPWEGNTRRQSHWQPRFSSQATVDEAVKNILAYMEEHPNTVSFSLTVNDGGGHCDTEKGREVETYYRWVNAVAEEVTKKYPNLIFGVAAYREVAPAPDFPLHPNVVSVITMDFHSTMDPKMKEKWEKLIKDWSKAGRFGLYSYNTGDTTYTLPRLYLREMQDMIKFGHEHGAATAFTERSFTTATEGPKMYVYFKLLENPDLDLEETVQDWCRAAVGEAAAPYLRQYYAFWEDFWRERATRTPWWNSSKDNIYLSLPPFGTYMLALDPGDMAKCRELMEKVVELASSQGTPAQKQRAEFLFATFEWYEANAIASSGEFFDAEGSLPNAEAALALLINIPRAQAAFARSKIIPQELKGWIAPNITTNRLENTDVVVGALSMTSTFTDDPAVRQELLDLSNNPEVSSQIRFLAGLMAKDPNEEDGDNLVADGTLETEEHGWDVMFPVHGSVERSSDVAARGTHSLKCNMDHSNFTAVLHLPEGKEQTDYYVSALVYLPGDQAVAEGRLNVWGNGTYRVGQSELKSRGRTRNIPDIMLNPGQWNYVSAIIPGDQLTDSLRVGLTFKSFERGDVAYIDDVRVYEIPGEAAP